jgi:hypothetical protein
MKKKKKKKKKKSAGRKIFFHLLSKISKPNISKSIIGK